METVPDTFPSLFWAYTIIWTIITVYLFSLSARLRKLERANAERAKGTEA